MTYISNRKIDFVSLEEDGTINVFDVSDWAFEYPFPWRYKLYYTFEENEKKLLSILYEDITLPYKFSLRMQKYLDNRKALYDEISTKYLPLVNLILKSDFSNIAKQNLINELDTALYKLYPYVQN